MNGIFKDKVVLITGGTGSFGQRFTEHLLFNNCNVREVIIFSRDEFKQYEMSKKFSPTKYPVRYFLGDIRDKNRLLRAFNGVDFVIHAAALKQVPALEYNPSEAINTNILGAQNIVDAALERSVKKIVAISTDKAVSPVNLYGATKLAMEKLFIAANSYVRYRDIVFSVVRYGNVIGSRGSVIPFFSELYNSGQREFPITDERMTRFALTLDEGVNLVIKAFTDAKPGDLLIPKAPSIRVIDLLNAFPEKCYPKITGIRPGEKLHETLICEDESRFAIDTGSHFVITPQFNFQAKRTPEDLTPNQSEFSYRSDTNKDWIIGSQLNELVLNANRS